MKDIQLRESLVEVLSELPGKEGGLAILLATASSPPALAVLSSGDVLVVEDNVRVGIHASSSAVRHLGGSFSLLIPLAEVAVRVEVSNATAEVGERLARIEGSIARLRPTAEPPWVLEMRFRALGNDVERMADYVAYWHGVRSWLAGASPEPQMPSET